MLRTYRTTTTGLALGLALTVPATTAIDAVTAPSASAAQVQAQVQVQATSNRLLRDGARGADVRAWQAILNRGVSTGVIDHPRLLEDGVFGPQTRSGTIALQAGLGVARDGIVGPVTRDGVAGLLDDQAPDPVHSDDRLLREGTRGDDVREWQDIVNRLSRAGLIDWPLIAQDGVFGPRTTGATDAVQYQLRITRDGIVGPVTREGAAGLLDGSR